MIQNRFKFRKPVFATSKNLTFSPLFMSLMGVYVLIILLILYILILPFIGVFYFIFTMPYINAAEENISGFKAVGKGIAFSLTRLKIIIPAGVVYTVCVLIIQMIPIVGSAEQIVDFPIMLTYMDLIYREHHQKSPYGDQNAFYNMHMYQYYQQNMYGPPMPGGQIPPPMPGMSSGQLKPPKIRS